ncbi:unnamed protein product [Polarella glacialis]|uniref:RNA helicase n=1 Tax=Polarella glacialis TaxID=89957 RepID=A0A813E622_POLGL|nr:unnamed protein product [Polarella glacialis]
MACSSGKTRVMYELSRKARGKVLVLVPSHVLLRQFAQVFHSFCCVGTGYNDKIHWDADGFIAMYNSAHLLANITFSELYVDEAHHALPQGCPNALQTYLFSATHRAQPDFRFSMTASIEDGVVCDYDVIIPIVTEGGAHHCLASMIQKRAGHFRRVLAFCNTVSQAKRFQQMVQELGLAAWHINGNTPASTRHQVISEFSGALTKPAHVLVTVQVLGEGVNIPNADTCLFIEPRGSYISVVQAVGRVLRHHVSKPLAHVILPAVSMDYMMSRTSMRRTPSSRRGTKSSTQFGEDLSHLKQVNFESRRENMTTGELERFLTILSQADVRLQDAIRAGGHGRVRFIYARLDASISCSPEHLIGSVQDYLSAWSHDHDNWEARLQDLKVFLAQRRYIPRQSSNDELEKTLGHWIKNQGTLVRQGKLSQWQLKSWSESHPLMSQVLLQWIQPGTKWQHRCQELAIFLKSHRRIPSTHSADPDECSLSSWLSRQTRSCKRLSSKQLQDLQGTHRLVAQYLQRKFDGPRTTWTKKCQELAAFVVEHDRIPKCAKQATLEYGLACWLQQQLRDHARLASDQINELRNCSTLVAQRIHTRQNPTSNWQQRLQEFSRFVSCHGRLPSRTAVDVSEKSLASWISNVGRDMATLGDEQIASLRSCPLLGETIERWLNDRLTCDQGYKQHCARLRVYIQRYDQLPKHNTDCKIERNLATWLARQLRAADNLGSGQLEALESVDPRVAARIRQRTATIQVWQVTCHELRQFVGQHGRCPRSKAGDGEELAWGQWLVQQSRRFRSFKEDELQILRATHPVIAERVDKWQDPLQPWRKRCKELKLFITNFGRLPRASSADAKERSVLSWLSGQCQSFRAGILQLEQLAELRAVHELIAIKVDVWCAQARADA